jgi:SSS family solute:Na+ symporter
MIKLASIDIIILAAYLLVVLIIGLALAGKNRSGSELFLAGRSLRWPFIALSLFATDMSSMAFIAVAGSGYLYGMLFAHYQWFTMASMLLLAFFLLRFYFATAIFTMPEFLAKRYGDSMQVLYSGISLFIYVLVDIPVVLLTSSILLSELIEVNRWWLIIGIAAFTTIYTISGGLRAVVYTDFIQSILIMIGGVWVSLKALYHPAVGGWQGLRAKLDPVLFDAFRPATDPDLPWTGILFGIFILQIWYWTTNQSIMQRVLGGRDLDQARKGVLFAGMLKFIIPFLGLVPGMCGILLYPGLERADAVYPRLVVDLVPAGVRGIVVATLFAALMSTIDSILNSSATLFTHDFYQKFIKKHASEKEALDVGRIAGVAVMAVGVALVGIYINAESIYVALQEKYAYFVGPIAVSFIGGIISRRANLSGAVAAFALGIPAACLLDLIPLTHSINFLHRVGMATAVACFAYIIASMMTKEPDESKLIRTTLWWQRNQPEEETSLPWYRDYRVFAIALVILSICTWLEFGLID